MLCSVACVVTLGNKRYESGIILQLAAYPHEKVRHHAVVVPDNFEEDKCTLLKDILKQDSYYIQPEDELKQERYYIQIMG